MACAAMFHNVCVLALFLPAALIGYWAVGHRSWKLAWLTAASLVFYSFWDVRFVPLLLGSAAVDFLLALRMERVQHRKPYLIASIIANLGTLAIFKYAVFATGNTNTLLQWLGVHHTIPGFNIVLPVGISFYTFQSMSYTIDVFRGQVPATRSPLKYVAFVTLFPQLVAGPIVRYKDLSKQLNDLPRTLTTAGLTTGVSLFVIGLFKKVVVADTIARHIGGLWASPGSLDAAGAWAASLGYTMQLYFDFSGYSDMAIGLGALLGLSIPINFRAPYKARNPSDFWRRWHISLSTFLRDYLYVPLGGTGAHPTGSG